jgi:hypothetical protein
MTDQPRFVARGAGYTSWAGHAVDGLEAVRVEEQEEQTRKAHAVWAEQQRRRWGQAARVIDAALAAFVSGGVDRRIASDLRVIRRTTERVARRLDT